MAGAGGQFGRAQLGLLGGLTRIGGVLPGSPAAFIGRQAITGGLIGLSGGGFASAGISKIGGGASMWAQRSLQGMGYRGLGSVVGGIGATATRGLGITASILGGIKGASFGIAAGVIGEGAKAIAGAASTFASAAASFAGSVLSLGRKIAGLGIATAVGVTAAGVREYGARQQAMSALGVVAGAQAPGVQSYLERTRSQFFSRTERAEAAAQGLVFGLEPSQVAQFLPGIQNASILTGKPVGEGLRAIARAALQAEPEAAEAYGLNLYERNIRNMFPGVTDQDLKNPNVKSQLVYAAAAQQLKRFEGAEGAIAGTIPGGGRALKTGTGEFLLTLGQSFAERFGLAKRLSAAGAWMQGPKGQGIAGQLGGFFGGVANRAAEFGKNVALPAAREFFSRGDEGTMASKVGDVAFNIAGGIVNFIKNIPALLVKASELFDKIRNWWEDFKKSDSFKKWVDYFEAKVVNPLRTLFESIKADFKGGNWEGLAETIGGALWKGFLKVQQPIEDMMRKAIAAGIKEGISNLGGAVGDKLGLSKTSQSAVGKTIGNFKYTLAGAAIGAKAAGPYGALALGAAGLGMDAGRYFFPDNRMHDGGVVPGPYGKEVPAVLQAGEMVISKEQARQLPRFHDGTLRDWNRSTAGWGRDWNRSTADWSQRTGAAMTGGIGRGAGYVGRGAGAVGRGAGMVGEAADLMWEGMVGSPSFFATDRLSTEWQESYLRRAFGLNVGSGPPPGSAVGRDPFWSGGPSGTNQTNRGLYFQHTKNLADMDAFYSRHRWKGPTSGRRRWRGPIFGSTPQTIGFGIAGAPARDTSNYAALANAARSTGYNTDPYGREGFSRPSAFYSPNAYQMAARGFQRAGSDPTKQGWDKPTGYSIDAFRDTVASALSPETYSPTAQMARPKSDFELAIEAAQARLSPEWQQALGIAAGSAGRSGGGNVNINGNIMINGNNNWKMAMADGV